MACGLVVGGVLTVHMTKVCPLELLLMIMTGSDFCVDIALHAVA